MEYYEEGNFVKGLYISVHYLIIEGEAKGWHGVGEVEVGAGSGCGLDEAHSATYRHGRDQDGFSEDLEDCSGHNTTHGRSIIRGFAPGSRGFLDGGGHTHSTNICYHIQATGIHGASMPTHMQSIHMCPFRRHIRLTGEWGENRK